MQREAARWNIKVTKETDRLGALLGSLGMISCDVTMLGFIEQAVRARVFQGVQERNFDAGPDELQDMIDSAVRDARAARGVN